PGVVGPWIDWNCDGTINAADASRDRYGDWMRALAQDLLDKFGTSGVSHVIFTQKPIEMGACQYFPAEPCANHATRSPTPSRPLDHYYLPTVYWEFRALESLFGQANLDSRIHWATPADHRRMWNRSAECYDLGIPTGQWTIPQSEGRPASIAADDT